MPSESDLDALRARWEATQDGETGLAYGEALEEANDVDAAKRVYRKLEELEYPAGLTSLAWVEHLAENFDAADALMEKALLWYGDDDDEDGALAAGVLGHWRWHIFNRTDAEELLRRGMHMYPDARADLADLLRATDRIDDAESLLREGVALAEKSSFIVLGNILQDSGRVDEAEEIYARGYDLGDAYCAYNLARMLCGLERHEEESDWMWKAAAGGDEWAIEALAGEAVEDE
jgi:tetratricopeptide (TPR) repeat protein